MYEYADILYNGVKSMYILYTFMYIAKGAAGDICVFAQRA